MMGMLSFLTADGQPKVEIGEINDDERVRLLCSGSLDEPVQDRPRFREDTQRFDETRNAETAIVGEQLSTARHQALTAQAENGRVGLTAPNFDCEGAGV